MQIIERKFNKIDVLFLQEKEIYLNATETAKFFKKQPAHWLRNSETQNYISTLSRISNLTYSELVLVKKGNFSDGREQGTWIHKKLITLFARWLSPEFAIWCDETIEEILRTGSLSLKTENFDLQKIRERAELLEISEKEFGIFERVFYKLGIERKEELAITTNRAVKKETGVDFLEIAEKRGLATPEKFYTVTELCEIVMKGDFSENAKKLVFTKKGDKTRPQNLKFFILFNISFPKVANL
jgi:hypothetical protein